MGRMLAHLAGSAVILASSTAAMADGVDSKYQPAPPAPYLGIQWEMAARYWISTGSYTKDLYIPGGGAQISKLSYDNLTAHTGELFFRGDHSSGLFLKGFVGGGSVTEGQMYDEDFPPFIAYTNTLQAQHDGNISYFTVDLGYTFLSNASKVSVKDSPTPWTYRLGGLVGYNYWREHLNTFGCAQTAITGYACAIETDFNGLDNDTTWRVFRLGLTGDVMLTNRLKLSGEVAYVTGDADIVDWHNSRPDIRGIREDSSGDGVQVEAILSYQVNPFFSLGLGGRYWTASGNGNSHFEDKGGVAQPINANSDRLGVFVQGSIKLDPASESPSMTADLGSLKDAPLAPPASWTGIYLGLNAGYGVGSTREDINGANALGIAFAAAGLLDQGAFSTQDTAGFLGGVQGGYNWQAGRSVLGLEADIAWANVSGSTGYAPPGAGFLTSEEQNIEWLSTLRLRTGYLPAPNMLMYVTGGLAFGETRLSLDVRELTGGFCETGLICSRGNSSGVSTGYAIGGGLEYMVSPGISLKGEYLYTDLGSRSVTTTDTGTLATLFAAPFLFKNEADFATNVFRVGLNFKLNKREPIESLK